MDGGSEKLMSQHYTPDFGKAFAKIIRGVVPFVARTPPHRTKVSGRVPDEYISLPDRLRDVRPDGAAELKDLVAAVLEECRGEKPLRDQFLVFRPWECPEIRSPEAHQF